MQCWLCPQAGVANLPNPVQDDDNTYVPRNMPAIGDLFELSERPPGSGRFTAPDQQVPHEELNDLVTLIQRRAPERRHAAIRTRTGWLDLDEFSLNP